MVDVGPSSSSGSFQRVDSHVFSIARTDRWVGAYALHLRFPSPEEVCIGRYNHGRPVRVNQGDYVYIGSAMGSGSGLHLPHRLIRHAMRCDGHPPHPCRGALLAHFTACDLPTDRLFTRPSKRLRWNIDYLLEQPSAEFVDVFYVRSERRLEHDLVQILESHQDALAPFPGLGAHDHPGHSHFFQLNNGSHTWHEACHAFARHVEEIS